MTKAVENYQKAAETLAAVERSDGQDPRQALLEFWSPPTAPTS